MRATLACWIPAAKPPLTVRWDAEFYVFGFGGHDSWPVLGKLKARIREGLRARSAEAAVLGLYRPSSIHDLALHDDDLAPMRSASWGAASPVGPGDVVLSKFLPVAVAWVTGATPRRPIDANCVRVIGLPAEWGFWIANVLEHPAYQETLARQAASAAVPRLGLRDLRALRVPNKPVGLDRLATQWTRASHERSLVHHEVQALQAEVNGWVDLAEPPTPTSLTPAFYRAAEVDDSWTPAHLALRAYQSTASRRGWATLADLLSEDSARLRGQQIEALRVLRLGDADGVFGFDVPDLTELNQPTFRLYGRPLDAGEVLLSVLGSSSKVVFNHSGRAPTVWISDHWARFQPSDDPGALALLLRSPVVAGQLALATTGADRQFVSRTQLLRVRLPWPDRNRRRRWHERLALALDRKARANEQLRAVRTQMRALVDEHLGGGA